MIFLFAARPCNRTTDPWVSSSPASTISVTIRQPPASTMTIASRNGVARASTNPITHSRTPETALTAPRAFPGDFIDNGAPAGATAYSRDKLYFQEASSSFAAVPARRSLESFGGSHFGRSDSAVWPRETQRTPRGVHQRLLRHPASRPYSEPGAGA